MIRVKQILVCLAASALTIMLAAGIANAADDGKPAKCTMTFYLKGWSAIYETEPLHSSIHADTCARWVYFDGGSCGDGTSRGVSSRRVVVAF